MGYQKDPRVDAYIEPLPEWQQEICRRVRDIVHERKLKAERGEA